MADIPLPPDIGRIRHLTAQMHKSEDDDGNPIPEGFIFAADGASGHTWLDPVTVGTGGTLVYNVQDYGAVGDGTTDDTTAIEDTFDAADATEGGIIYFPPTADYYKITSLITRTGTSKYHLVGGGARYGPARVHQVTSNTGAFKFAPTTGTANRVTAPQIENLTISGAGSASSGRGVEFANDGHMNDCFVYGFSVGVFVATESYYSTFRNVSVSDCDSIAIHLNGTNNTTIDTCRVTGLFSTGSPPIGTVQHGIVITGGITQRVLNTTVEYFTGYGIAVEGGSTVIIVGNYFETQQSTTGFAHLWLGNSSTTKNAIVRENYFQGDAISGFNAIKLDNVETFAIIENEFGRLSAIGIAHTGGSSKGMVWGNVNNPAGTFTLPSDTITSPGGAAFATPAIVLGTAAAAGSAGTVIRSDSTIVAFDATSPTNEAIGDSAATGSAAVAARRDHKHGMPAFGSPVAVSSANADGSAVTVARSDHVHQGSTGGVGAILISDTPSTPLIFADLIQNEAGTDLVYQDI